MVSGENASSSMSWEEIVARKRSLQREQIWRFKQRSDINSLETTVDGRNIIDIDHFELRDMLAGGRTTSESVTAAYIRRAITAHEQTNCLTEILFESALERARHLDNYLSQNGKPIGPLHGLPLSLKDQFNVKGVDSTIGYVGRAFCPAEKDAAIVQIMKDMGAVIIAKTNVPQSILMAETNNPLWGLTVNPVDASFTPGGSSGGEAALLAMHGSLIGWGTDIGGSIRGPSHFMGLYGLKPSNGRLPYYGVANSIEGQEHCPSVAGPLTRSLSSLLEIAKSVVQAEPWKYDPRCLHLPWRSDMYEDVLSRPLTVGVIFDDGVVRVHPPIERALKHLVDKLKKNGHEIVDWGSEEHKDIIGIQDQYYTADGGEDIKRDLAVCNEPFQPQIKALVERGEPISVYQYWQLNRRKLEYQKRYLDRWNATRGSVSGRSVDVILAPVMGHGAVPHNSCRWVGYTKVWNFLDYSALSFPVTTVDCDLDRAPPYSPRNPIDEWNWNLYDAERMHGHPVGLQVIGQRLTEEKVLAAAAVFEKVLAS